MANDKSTTLSRTPNRIVVATVSDVRAVTGKKTDDYIVVLGKDTVDDNNARNYRWDATSVAVDDGDTVIKPTEIVITNPGRWLKVIYIGTATIPTFKTTISADGIVPDYYIEHNLGTSDIMIEVINISFALVVYPRVGMTSINGVTLTFSPTPTDEEDFRVIIIAP